MELLVLKLYQHASCSLISEKAYDENIGVIVPVVLEFTGLHILD